MSETNPVWLQSGQGDAPEKRWSFSLDAPLAGFRLAAESGDVLAADTAGGLYRIDRRGKLASLTRGFLNLGGLAWSDLGNCGAAVTEENRLCCFDEHLKIDWSIELPEPVTSIDMDPRGRHIGVALANGQNVVYNTQRKMVCRFETSRPLKIMRFLVTEPAIIAAAEYGLLVRFDLTGREIWSENLQANIGDFCVSGDGTAVFASAFNMGIRTFDAEGSPSGSYLVEGTPHRLNCTYDAGRLLATTLEGHLYWLDADGEIVWAATLPEDIEQVHCEPLGTGLICGFASGRLVNLAWK